MAKHFSQTFKTHINCAQNISLYYIYSDFLGKKKIVKKRDITSLTLV